MPVEISILHTAAADVWVAWDGEHDNSYAYGGCRMVGWRTRTEDAIAVLCSLMQNESGYKNRLINEAVADGVLADVDDRLPPGFREARVGGARCVIRPAHAETARVLADPGDPAFLDTVNGVFAPLGQLLEAAGGRIKLTPDFGRFAGLADILHQYTPHVLGVSREGGGCGGKSSYSAAGVLAAYHTLAAAEVVRGPRVTVIGSDGAMGRGVLQDLLDRQDRVLTVCDLSYDDGSAAPPRGVRRLPASPGRFSAESLATGDTVIATTWGGELERSDRSALRPGTVLLLAHNLAVPSGVDGVELMREVLDRGAVAVPGQVLTLGGALTSRLEWYSRAAGRPAFDKPLAHEVVRRVVGYWTLRLVREAAERATTPYEAMLDVCDERALSAAAR